MARYSEIVINHESGYLGLHGKVFQCTLKISCLYCNSHNGHDYYTFSAFCGGITIQQIVLGYQSISITSTQDLPFIVESKLIMIM